jgi:hypothetical protein
LFVKLKAGGSLRLSVLFSVESVAYPSNRLKKHRITWIRLKIFSEADNEIIERPCFHITGVPPDSLQQFAPAHRFTLFLKQKSQHPHFEIGKINLTLGSFSPV